VQALKGQKKFGKNCAYDQREIKVLRQELQSDVKVWQRWRLADSFTKVGGLLSRGLGMLISAA
jgi:hypothetical protein